MFSERKGNQLSFFPPTGLLGSFCPQMSQRKGITSVYSSACVCSKLWCFYLRREYSCLLPLKSGRGRFLGSSPRPCCLFSCPKPGEGNRTVKHSSPARVLPSSRPSAQPPLWKLPSQTAPPGTPTLLIRTLLPPVTSPGIVRLHYNKGDDERSQGSRAPKWGRETHQRGRAPRAW